MNINRISLFFLSTIVLFTLLIGCSDDSSSQTGKESNGTATENVTTNSEPPAKDVAEVYEPVSLITADEFKNFISEYVDLSHYSVSPSKDSLFCNIDNQFYKAPQLDFEISLNNKPSFTMPISFAELNKLGWKLPSNTQILKPGYLSFGLCENSDGNEIYVEASNLTSGDLPFNKCSVTSIESTLFGSGDKFSKKFSSASEFTVCKKLTDKSTLQDVIDLLGEPSLLNFSNHADYGYCYIELEYRTTASSFLRFHFTPDGERIIQMKYSL
ncbi:MAG: hypothetical protein E7473_03365 [Ruminococcaceae bacterium]|nr:hypothetical protein [Oscillospiraceae bacterium]